jgi:hypothetical protein
MMRSTSFGPTLKGVPGADPDVSAGQRVDGPVCRALGQEGWDAEEGSAAHDVALTRQG